MIRLLNSGKMMPVRNGEYIDFKVNKSEVTDEDEKNILNWMKDNFFANYKIIDKGIVNNYSHFYTNIPYFFFVSVFKNKI